MTLRDLTDAKVAGKKGYPSDLVSIELAFASLIANFSPRLPDLVFFCFLYDLDGCEDA